MVSLSTLSNMANHSSTSAFGLLLLQNSSYGVSLSSFPITNSIHSMILSESGPLIFCLSLIPDPFTPTLGT